MRKTRGVAPAANGATARRNYRQMLLDKRHEALANLGIKFDTVAKLGRVAEEDQAQISHDEFVNLRLNKLDYDKLKLVNEALDRLETGEYGVCERCEEPIPPKRLEAVPWAKYCVHCQEELARDYQEEEEPALLARTW
ncbi:MAG: TraR/DksA family transcriptional regulator [Acidobacteria bacterium]|nr:TraR/DksA family transcriptional regulator [Acidobacteriota bacterium]